MKKTLCILLFVGIFALAFIGVSHIMAAESTHWATKYVDRMVSEQILPKTDVAEWDKPIKPEMAVDALSKAIGKSIGAIDPAKFTRAEFAKLAVDNSAWAGDLESMKFPAWCMSNDELTIPADFVPYFNMGYRPKYDFLTYRKGRLTAWDKPPTFAETAFLCDRFKHNPNTEKGQSVVVVTAQEPDTMNPNSSALSRTMLVTFMSWGNSDVSYGDDATLFPIYVTRVPSVDNGDVKLIVDPISGRTKETVTYHIRQGLYQHPMYDGEENKLHEITADDYVYAFRVGVCPRIQNTTKSGTWKIDAIRRLDKYTIELDYNEVYTYATWGAGSTYKARFEQDLYTDPSDFNVRQDFIDYTTGPYKMVKWDRGDHIEFAPNPYSDFGQPLMDKIVVRFMSDTNTIRLNLQSNAVDVVSNAFTPIEASGLAQTLPQYKFVYTEGTSWEHLDLNQHVEPEGSSTPGLKWVFGDKRVRQAMLYALNREELCKVVSNGVFTPSNSWMPARSKYYNDELAKKYPYDPTMAEKLLDEAGWKLTKVGSENVRCLNGDPKKPFMFEIKTTSEQEFRVKNIEQMQKMWARVGLKIVTRPVPAKELFGQSLTRHEWQIVEFAWVSNPIRPNCDLFMSSQIPTKDNGWQGQNIGGWPSSPEHDALCTQMTLELPEAKLQDVYNQQMKIWTDELPALPLFNRYDVDVCPIDLENFKPTGTQVTPNWNSAWWYREKLK